MFDIGHGLNYHKYMESSELMYYMNQLLPKLYKFSFALVGEETMAEQLIIDGHTVFTMREKKLLLKEKFSKGKGSIRFKKYLFRQLVAEIYELASQRINNTYIERENLLEYESFYKVQLRKRALIYLKEIENFKVEELQEVFMLQRHEVLEIYYNVSNEILIDREFSTAENQIGWN